MSAGDRKAVWFRMAASIAALAVLTGLLFFVAGDGFYPWAKALHVIAVISWMAGMLYLPRLFVYHAGSRIGSEQSETFKIMERRLMLAIINPAMTLAWVLGLWLAWRGFAFQGGWLHAKLVLVLLLSALHGYFSAALRKFANDQNDKTARHWRIVNEVPTLLMIGIVILVIVKPF